jgi:hypothetical protein
MKKWQLTLASILYDVPSKKEILLSVIGLFGEGDVSNRQITCPAEEAEHRLENVIHQQSGVWDGHATLNSITINGSIKPINLPLN